jgi:voltage-gated potassium channel
MARLRPHRRWLRYLIPLAVLVVVTGGAGLAAFATDTAETYWDGIWWSISLMTTVGWSGPAPTTFVGHLIATITMVTGFLLLAFISAAIASVLVREDEEPVDVAELEAESAILQELRSLRAEVRALAAANGDHDAEHGILGRHGSLR